MLFKLTMLPLLPVCSREPPPHERIFLKLPTKWLSPSPYLLYHTFALVLALALVVEHLVVVQRLPEADRLYYLFPSQLYRAPFQYQKSYVNLGFWYGNAVYSQLQKFYERGHGCAIFFYVFANLWSPMPIFWKTHGRSADMAVLFLGVFKLVTFPYFAIILSL